MTNWEPRKNREAYEEDLFASLMADLAAREAEEAWEELCRLDQDPEAAVPDRVDRACRKLLRRRGRWGTLLFRSVAVLLLVAGVTTAVCVTSPEAKLWLANTLSLPFLGQTGQASTWEAPGLLKVEPGWLPEGSELVSSVSTRRAATRVYQAPEGTVTLERLWAAGEAVELDTRGETRNVTLQGRNAVLVEQEAAAWVMLPVPESQTALLITVEGLDTQTLLNIAETVVL